VANTDPEVVQFSDREARALADLRVREYRTAKQFIANWGIRNMTAKVTNDAVKVGDNAPGDGRKSITGADLVNLYNRCLDLVADLEASGNAKLNQLLAISSNDLPLY